MDAENDSPASISTTNETNVPDENMLIKQEQSAKTTKSSSQPMNLTNEHGKVKNEIDGIDYGHGAESMDVPDYSDAVCKIGKTRSPSINLMRMIFSS